MVADGSWENDPMMPRQIRLYGRPDCTLCDEAAAILEALTTASPGAYVMERIDVERDPDLHARLFTEIPAIEIDGQLLAHATSRLRIASFLDVASRGEAR